ncbi:MAG: LysE family translocator [Hyphomonadaceae bacterium]|nr:LysE family translocator [Hyphomonadaceae bacterium]
MPTLESLGAFLAASLLMELTPGPNMGYLAILSMQSGRQAGVRAVAGVTAGLCAILVASAFGVAEIAARQPIVLHALRWAGCAYMLWLAWDCWRDADAKAEEAIDPQAPFVRGFIANVLNPKAALLYVALTPSFIRPDGAPYWAQTLILGSLHIAVSIVVHLATVLAAARVGAVVLGPQASARERFTRRGFALALAAIAVWLFFAARPPAT